MTANETETKGKIAPPHPSSSSIVVVGRFVTQGEEDNYIFMRSEFECYLDGKLNTSYKDAYKMCKPCKPIQIVNIPSSLILKSYVSMMMTPYDSLNELNASNGLSDQAGYYFIFVNCAMISL